MPFHMRTTHFTERRVLARLLHRGIVPALGLLLVNGVPRMVQGQDCLYVLTTTVNGGAITKVDRASRTVLTNVPLANCSQPQCLVALALTKDATRAYVARFETTGTVEVRDPVTGSAIATVPVGSKPSALALHPDDSKLYVANLASNSVSVIATDSNQVVDTIEVGGRPRALAVTPDASLVFVGNSKDDSVSVIRAADGSVMSPPIAVAHAPAGIAVSPNGTQVYVSSDSAGSVSVIDVGSLSVVGTIAVGQRPRGIAFTPDGGSAYVTNFSDGTVSRIDTAARTAADPITVGENPLAVVVSSDGADAYVANFSSNTVSIIDTATESVTAIDQLPGPYDLALGPCSSIPPPTPTATSRCVGDCNRDGMVTINELVVGVNIALGTQPVSACTAVDADGNGMVAINELVRAVGNALNGCTA